eukprot:SAG31_NODE_2486_length_5622_cov_3.274489_1_plen_93_part_00
MLNPVAAAPPPAGEGGGADERPDARRPAPHLLVQEREGLRAQLLYDLGLPDIPQGLRETIPYRDVPFLRPERVRQAAFGGRQVPVDVFLNSH